jgi:hypothetical protein
VHPASEIAAAAARQIALGFEAFSNDKAGMKDMAGFSLD